MLLHINNANVAVFGAERLWIMLKPVAWVFVLAMVLTTMVACSKTRGDHQNNVPQYTSQSAPDAKDARRVVTAIANEAIAKKNLTDKQITILNYYADSPDMLVRMQVMSALRYAGPEHAQAAVSVARKGLKSIDSITRLSALRTLDQLNAPDIVSIAKRLSNDRSQYVRPEAERILKKRGA